METNKKQSDQLDPSVLDQYLETRWQLIPLHKPFTLVEDRKGRKKLAGKIPLHRNWQKQVYDSKEIIATAGGIRNVGVRPRKDQVVIDVDPRNGGELGFKRLCNDFGINADNYPTVITGSGGKHLYATKPADLPVLDTLEGYAGVEFKSAGRQVVAAGSLHPETRRLYEWDFLSVPLKDAPPLPSKLLKAITRPKPEKFASGAGEYSP